MSEDNQDWCEYECEDCGDVISRQDYEDGNGFCDMCNSKLTEE